MAEWLPALDGVVAKLEAGALVADVGCGHGASTILLAEAFPASHFVGIDYHADSIATARKRAGEAGVDDRVRFEVAGAADFAGAGYDLVAFFDAFHDLGDPLAAARHAAKALAPGGTVMLVEPLAGDTVEENLNPIGRLYYGFSTLVCTPGSLSQPGRAGLGTQAGEARARRGAARGRVRRGPPRRGVAAQPRARGAARLRLTGGALPARRPPHWYSSGAISATKNSCARNGTQLIPR